MRAHVVLNFLYELRKSDKLHDFFATRLINSITREHNVIFFLSYDIKTM